MSSNPKDESQTPSNIITEAQIKEALQGTDMGSDTRAGSLRGGSASGSEIDPDQQVINEDLARMGERLRKDGAQPSGGPEEAAKPEGQQGDDADAPTS